LHSAARLAGLPDAARIVTQMFEYLPLLRSVRMGEDLPLWQLARMGLLSNENDTSAENWSAATIVVVAVHEWEALLPANSNSAHRRTYWRSRAP